jgi:hypothetical protein
MTVMHDGFASAAEGAQQAIVMRLDGSKRGSENIGRTRQGRRKNMAHMKKIYGAPHTGAHRTDMDIS